MLESVQATCMMIMIMMMMMYIFVAFLVSNFSFLRVLYRLIHKKSNNRVTVGVELYV